MVVYSPIFVFLLLMRFAGAEFYHPPEDGHDVFKVGQVETITYKTSYKEYTIAVWQQSLDEGAAALGPIVYQTTDGPKGRFDWLVQTYDFNLQASNVFFFWLFEGNASAQGNQSLASMSSSFFNITDDAAEKPTTLPSTTLAPTTTSSSLSVAPTHSSHDNENKKSNQLSAGAIAGISVGAGLAVLGIGVGIATVFWLKHQKKKTQPENTTYSAQAYPPSYYDQSWKPPPEQPYHPPRSPVEIGS